VGYISSGRQRSIWYLPLSTFCLYWD